MDIKNIKNTYLKNEAINDMSKKNEQVDTPVVDQEIETETANQQERIVALEKEIEELKDLALRKTAELENFRKRTIKEKQDIVEYANEKLLAKLLPIIDDLEVAISSTEKTQDYVAFFEGMKLIQTKTLKTFEEVGVTPIEIEPNTPFNVDFHEAIMLTPSETIEEGNIVQQVQKGYLLREKVLRHSKVITSSGK
jgi:molecular chaperone GrpE